MKHEEKKSNESLKPSREEILSVVASQIKGKSLFPKKIEEAKKMLSRARFAKGCFF